MATLELTASGIVDPSGTRFCPFDHPGYTGPSVTASVVSTVDDLSQTGFGNELVTYRCMLDHEWTQPSTRQQIRMMGWAQHWRARRDQFAENPPSEADVTLQQITPVIDGF